MHSRKLTLSWISLLGATALSTFGVGECRAEEAPHFVTSEPEGFSNLASAQSLLIDVYFGGDHRGEVLVSVTPETVEFLDPEALLGLFPELSEPQFVQSELSHSKISTHSELVCTPTADKSRCGRLSPDTVGVIFDRDRFRLDIFFNPKFLNVLEPLEKTYLPTPARDLALVNTFNAIASGRSGMGSKYYTLQDQLIVSRGEQRLRGALSYSNELGLGADYLALEWDKPELRYSAGALRTRGSTIAGQQKIIGLGLESQIDTRLDKELISGSPLVVFLDRRARVDVIRDGRVLSSAIYEAGNQQLETSGLPEGSYEIVLRIEEVGRAMREERRFYTKSRRIPSIGRNDWFLLGGMLVDHVASGSLDPGEHPFVQAGIIHRQGQSWAFDGTVQVTDSGGEVELGATLLTPVAQLRAALVADTETGRGAILQLASSGGSHFNFNFDIRHIKTRSNGLLAAISGPGYAEPQSGLALEQSEYLQLGGVVSYSTGNLRFLGTASYRDEGTDNAQYSVGPSLEWDIARKGALQVTLRSDITLTERGNAGFAGISVRLLGSRFTSTALAGGRRSSISDDELSEGAVAAFAGSGNFKVAGGEMAIGAGFEQRSEQNDAILSSEFRHALATLSGELVRSSRDERSTTQYSFGFQSTQLVGAGTIKAVGRTSTESMVITKVKGARAEDRFEVLVNEQVLGTIEGSETLELSLPSYRAYRLRIRPTGDGLVSYDSAIREVSLFPGAVSKVEWEASPVTIKLGRLIDLDGNPISNATITGKGVWSQTDEDGNFQIEISDQADVQLTLADGSIFLTTIFADAEASDLAQVETITCCEGTAIRLSAINTQFHSLDGDKR